jgi:hypothetical protein
MDEEGGGVAEAAESGKFDFDLWVRLARLDPVEFERQRELYIARFMGSHCNNREEIENLRKRIERARNQNVTPMENLQWLLNELANVFEQLDKFRVEQAQHKSRSLH